MLTSACPAYASTVVLDVAEAEGVAPLVLGEPVVTLGSGVGVAGGDRRLDGRPPGLDGRGEPVHLRQGGGGGLGVEGPQPLADHVPVGVGARQLEQGPQVLLDRVRVQDLDAGVACVDQGVPQLRERDRAQSLVGGQQPTAAGPLRVRLAAAAAADVAGGVLADLGDHVVRKPHQVEPVGDYDRVRQCVGDRPQVGRGQIDRHMGDIAAPRIRLLLKPFDHLGCGPPIDVGEQPTGAGGVDDPRVPPVMCHPPLPGGRVLLPLGLAAAGLINAQHAHQRQWVRQQGVDMGDVRAVRDRPGHPVVLGARLHAREPVRDPGAALAAQPARHPRAGRDGRDRLSERGPATGPLPTASTPLVPHQPHRRRPVRDVPRLGGRVPLDRGGEHPTGRARRSRLIVGDHVRHPRAVPLNVNRDDSQPRHAEQPTRRVLDLVLDILNLRTLDQARDLTFVTMNCLDNSHDHRGHGPLTSGQDTRACPVKFEEPFNDHHAFLLTKMLARIDQLSADIADVEERTSAQITPFADAVARLDEIPGIGVTAAQAIIAEIGLNMTRFPTPAHLCSWAKFAPGIKESAGRKKGNGDTGHGNRYLARVLGEAAVSAARTDTFLGERYRRIARRRGKRAVVAVGRSILVIIWHLLNVENAQSHDLGPDYYDSRVNLNRKMRNHVRELQHLGYRVTLEPAA